MMLIRCRRRPRLAASDAAETANDCDVVVLLHAEEANAPLPVQPQFEGRWRVVQARWAAELRYALARTRGNVELAVALAGTMIFAD